MGAGVGADGPDPSLPWALPLGRRLGRSVRKQDLTPGRLCRTSPPAWPSASRQAPRRPRLALLPSVFGGPCRQPQPGPAQQSQQFESLCCPPPAAPTAAVAAALCGAAPAPHPPGLGGPRATAPAGSEVTHLGPGACLLSGTQASICEEGRGLLSGGLSCALPASGAGMRAGAYPFGSG